MRINKAKSKVLVSSALSLCIASALVSAQNTPTAEEETATAGRQAPEEDETTATAENDTALDTVVVQGYRRSVQFATESKREATNFTDSVFAEDIGKFPDLNIAESLNRIPGIQLTREINGEGLNIAIRGLGTNFTKTLLNGSQIAVASTGRTDSQNQNRELDLDLFPTELFTQLDVNKTPMASMLEGGVSGVVNMRSARPFDTPGTHFTYQLQGGYGEISEDFSPRAAMTTSWTNDTFGVLFGLAGVNNKSTVEGFETIGWTNPNLTFAQCGLTPPTGTPVTNPAAACNIGGGNGWVIPALVPANAGLGLSAGATIDRNFLLAQNPGLTIEQLDQALIPRLGRPAYVEGERDRASALLSLEYRPSDSAQFYLDMIYSDANRKFDRLDMNLIGRNGGLIPVGIQVDENNVVTSGQFANAQFFLEARPYEEDVDFQNFNPGAHFVFGDDILLDVQANVGRSNFYRESPTILVNTPLNQGIFVDYDNSSGDIPQIDTNVDLNDPGVGWTWAGGGRVNIQNEWRVSRTRGGHADLQFGDDPRNNFKVGLGYDDISRDITALDNSAAWEDIACRGLNADGSVPNPRPGCVGGPLAAIMQSALSSFLQPGPGGFITADFRRFMDATNYRFLSENAPEANSSNTGANSGSVDEETIGAYVEFNTEGEVFSRELRLNAGVRYVHTDQDITGPVTIGGVRQDQTLSTSYEEYLPSFNVAWDVMDDVILRFSSSRTLTRANPSQMLPNTVFSDPSAQQATQGNPNLSPFLSTNFDVGGEWYTGAEGYVGLTYFQKRLTGFTVNGSNTIPFLNLGIPFEDLSPTQQQAIIQRGGPEVATVTVNQQVNASGTLSIRGWEATWVQPLDNIIDGFGFSANYTRVSQRSSGQGIPAQAIGISPNTYNLTSYYENHNASIRLSYVWNDDQISSGPNQNGIPIAQLRTDARGQLDLSASYALPGLWSNPSITFNIINITSEKQRSTFQYDNAAFTLYDPGYTVLVGIRGTF